MTQFLLLFGRLTHTGDYEVLSIHVLLTERIFSQENNLESNFKNVAFQLFWGLGKGVFELA